MSGETTQADRLIRAVGFIGAGTYLMALGTAIAVGYYPTDPFDSGLVMAAFRVYPILAGPFLLAGTIVKDRRMRFFLYATPALAHLAGIIGGNYQYARVIGALYVAGSRATIAEGIAYYGLALGPVFATAGALGFLGAGRSILWRLAMGAGLILCSAGLFVEVSMVVWLTTRVFQSYELNLIHQLVYIGGTLTLLIALARLLLRPLHPERRAWFVLFCGLALLGLHVFRWLHRYDSIVQTVHWIQPILLWLPLAAFLRLADES